MGSILYFIIAAACLYGPLAMIFRPKKSIIQAQKLIILMLLITAAVFALMGCLSMESLRGNIWIELAFSTLAPFIGFFFYLAVKSLTSPDGIRIKDLSMLIPVAAIVFMGYIFDIVMGKEVWSAYVGTVFNSRGNGLEGLEPIIRNRFYLSYWGLRLFLLVQLVAVLFRSNKLLKIYSHELENYYSELTGLADSMNIYTTSFTWAAAVVSAMFVLSDNVPGSHLTLLTVITGLVAIVAFVCIAGFTSSIEHSASDIAKMAAEDAKKAAEKQAAATAVAQTSGSQTSIERYAKALKAALAEEVYLEPGLELTDLADRIGTNRTYLSNIIHDEYGQNFSEFINSRRISYAIKLMTEATESYPVRYIAMKSGYNSLQSFYNNFAKYTGGKTPASYLKK